MYKNIYIYTHIYTHLYMYKSTSIYTYPDLYMQLPICLFTYQFICLFVRLFVWLWTFVYVFMYHIICIYVYICIYIYVYTHTHTYTYTYIYICKQVYRGLGGLTRCLVWLYRGLQLYTLEPISAASTLKRAPSFFTVSKPKPESLIRIRPYTRNPKP